MTVTRKARRIGLRGSRGVTLTELLVVLAILGLLATIAIPVYVNKMEQAKFKVAVEECEEIAQAEQACAIIHGFYVPLQLLDNIPVNQSNQSFADDLDNEDLNNMYLVDAFVDVDKQRTGTQKRLADFNADKRVGLLYYNWNGPFLNPTRVFVPPNEETSQFLQTATGVRRDFPLDPWGHPYRLYSPIGVVGSDAIVSNPTDADYDNDTFSNGVVTNNDDRFDVFAIVSFGPDGEPQEDQDDEPDIVYTFGHVVNETAYRAW